MNHKRNTAIGLFIAATLALSGTPAGAAGIPVIDAANLGHNILTATEQVAQTLKQIEQYTLQLPQYENQLLNSAAPAAHIWSQAQSTINGLVAATNTLERYKVELGNIESYLNQFNDLAYYKSSPCYTAAGCSIEEQERIDRSIAVASQAQKRAADGLMRGIEQQNQTLQSDATTLQRLQAAAQSATGQTQALGYANQLASQQTSQLLQIRALLVSQQNVMAAQTHAEVDRAARQAAAAKELRRSVYQPSPSRSR